MMVVSSRLYLISWLASLKFWRPNMYFYLSVKSKWGRKQWHTRNCELSCMCLMQKFANSQCCRSKVGYASSETFYSKNKDDTDQDLKWLVWLAESARFAQETSSFEGTAHFKSIIEKPWKWVFYISLTSPNQPFVTGCNWLRDRHCVNLVRLFQELLM